MSRECCLNVFRVAMDIGIFGATLRLCHIVCNLLRSSEIFFNIVTYEIQILDMKLLYLCTFYLYGEALGSRKQP